MHARRIRIEANAACWFSPGSEEEDTEDEELLGERNARNPLLVLAYHFSVGRVLADSWTRRAAIRVPASGHIVRPSGPAARDWTNISFCDPDAPECLVEPFGWVSARRGCPEGGPALPFAGVRLLGD